MVGERWRVIASIWGSKFWEGSGVEGTGIWSNGFARVFGGNREAAKVGDDPPSSGGGRSNERVGSRPFSPYPLALLVMAFFFSFSLLFITINRVWNI